MSRLVVFGDVHGAFDALIGLLQAVDVIDEQARWSGGDSHLVSLGDLLDRGPDSRKVMDLLMRLQGEAAAAGGRVHVLLGNHELMNLTGDLRYLSAAEIAAFAPDETDAQRSAGFARLEAAGIAFAAEDYAPGYFAYREAFAPDGHYGRWLLELPAVVVIDDNAFAHGGFPAFLLELSLDEINRQFSDGLRELLTRAAELQDAGMLPPGQDLLNPDLNSIDDASFNALSEAPLFSVSGPLWYRGTALCHPLIESARVSRSLAHFDVERLIVGHTPTVSRRIEQRFDGRVLLADTGMLKSYYDGQASAVVIEGDSILYVYPESDGTDTRAPESPLDRRSHYPADMLSALFDQVRASAATGAARPEVALHGARFQPVFTPGDKRSIKHRLAAFQLDQLLGFGLVTPLIEWREKGERGTLALLPVDPLTEAERAANERPRTQWCQGLADYQLMYIFDALSANASRTPETILYDRGDWSLWLRPGDEAFATSADFPGYIGLVEPLLPAALKASLAALTLEELEEEFADTLTRRQIRALDRRRQRLLESWTEVD